MDRGDQDDASQWPLPGMPGGLLLASYLTAAAADAAQYRLIVDILLDEQQRSLAGVSRADLAVLLRDRLRAHLDGQAGLELGTLPLDGRLDQLVRWGVADQWPGPGGRRYQLTEAAARLHRAVRQLSPDPGRPDPGCPDPGRPDPGRTDPGRTDPGRSVAASFAPPVLAGQLGRLASARPDQPGEAAQAWSAVRTTFEAMTEAAAGWQARLAAALAGAADPARVAALEDTLRRYLDVWGTGVDRHSGLIAARAAGLLDAGPATWRAAALHSLGAAATEDRLSELLSDYRATLGGLLDWFGPGDNTSRRLRRQMRDVVVPLVRGQRALATTGGQLSQRADLLALAGALERSATDDGAWSLWCTATGLFAARHLPHPSPQPAGPAGSVSFWAAEPVPGLLTGVIKAVEPLTTGSGTGARVARMPDRSAARAAARAAAAAQQATADQTRHAIQARSGLQLSRWTGLDAGQLDVLLSFLAALAAARPGQDGSRTVRTPDGRWTVRAEPAPDDTPPAVIRTPAGQLVHPDLRLTIAGGAR